MLQLRSIPSDFAAPMLSVIRLSHHSSHKSCCSLSFCSKVAWQEACFSGKSPLCWGSRFVASCFCESKTCGQTQVRHSYRRAVVHHLVAQEVLCVLVCSSPVVVESSSALRSLVWDLGQAMSTPKSCALQLYWRHRQGLPCQDACHQVRMEEVDILEPTSASAYLSLSSAMLSPC